MSPATARRDELEMSGSCRNVIAFLQMKINVSLRGWNKTFKLRQLSADERRQADA
jgi:hypothetical protein